MNHILGWHALVVTLLGAALQSQSNWRNERLLGRSESGAMAYDSARGRVVRFGGYFHETSEGRSPVAGTWEWDGASWIHRNAETSPPPRWQHAMAYDEARQRVVLFGGADADGDPRHVLGDTWEWDGTNWLRRTPATSPPPRAGHALAYDAARQSVVAFGGLATNGNPLDDTWEWDGTQWLQRSSPSNPAPRIAHALAYDQGRGRVVLFGGFSFVQARNDTWEWDGTSWVQRVTAVNPTGRYYHALAYDSARQRILLSGGETSADVRSNETWEWDGAVWSQRLPATIPTGRQSTAMAFDAARQRVVMVDGSHSALTWEWDGVDWTQRNRDIVPPPRAAHAIAHDTARNRVVLFGGWDYTFLLSNVILNDTWEWDGTGWVGHQPATRPAPRTGHAMAFDAARNRVVLFGGSGPTAFLADTWEWDGTNWTQRQPPQSPSPRQGAAIAYDATRGRVVLSGGVVGATYLGDTWEWDGTTWQARGIDTPPRAFGAMAYDGSRQCCVLFGGIDRDRPLDDTWEWDGRNWSRRFVAVSPPVRSGHALAYDSARGRVVLFGGSQYPRSPLFRRDTWEWDGTSWVQQNPATAPPGAGLHAMVYDAVRRRTTLFGGDGDLWHYDADLAPARQTIGTACSGTSGLPVLTSGLPFLGNTGLVIDLLSVRPASLCFLGIAPNTQALQLGGGCTLYLDAPLIPLLTFTNASGFASVKLSVPRDAGLRGGVAYVQGFVSDPVGGFANLAFSAGLKLTFGD